MPKFRNASAIALVSLTACAAPRSPAKVTRLVDLYRPEVAEGGAKAPDRPLPRTEWRFDAPIAAAAPATRGWDAASAIAGLAVRDGRLEGKAIGEVPLLHVERTQGLEDHDQLHEVQIRLRVSAGANVAVSFEEGEKLDVKETLEQRRVWGWSITSPLVPGPELRTYTLRSSLPVTASEIRHVLVRPTDSPGASFAIESVRLVFRKEHLASIASGPSWQGLSEVYRETLVSRSPETLRFGLRLPSHPWLDLALGTIEDGPVTFRVGRATGDAARGRVAREDRDAATPLGDGAPGSGGVREDKRST